MLSSYKARMDNHRKAILGLEFESIPARLIPQELCEFLCLSMRKISLLAGFKMVYRSGEFGVIFATGGYFGFSGLPKIPGG